MTEKDKKALAERLISIQAELMESSDIPRYLSQRLVKALDKAIAKLEKA